jgi:hypothetical protein
MDKPTVLLRQSRLANERGGACESDQPWFQTRIPASRPLLGVACGNFGSPGSCRLVVASTRRQAPEGRRLIEDSLPSSEVLQHVRQSSQLWSRQGIGRSSYRSTRCLDWRFAQSPGDGTRAKKLNPLLTCPNRVNQAVARPAPPCLPRRASVPAVLLSPNSRHRAPQNSRQSNSNHTNGPNGWKAAKPKNSAKPRRPPTPTSPPTKRRAFFSKPFPNSSAR